MKKYKITFYDGVCKTRIIMAENRTEALEIAWELFPEQDDLYVSEVEE